MFSAKEALLLSLKRSNNIVSNFIESLETRIKESTTQGDRNCDDSITLQNGREEINIGDVVEYFETLGFTVNFNRDVSPFNKAITYKVTIQW